MADPKVFIDVVKYIELTFGYLGIECVGEPKKAVNIMQLNSLSIKRDVGESNVPYSPLNCAYIMLHMTVQEQDYPLRI